MTYLYLEKAFAESGDQVSIPFPTQVDGSVSFTDGWTYDYQRDPDPLVDPLTKPVPRDQTNWLMGVMTSILKQYQDSGAAPLWSSVRAADEGYPKNARVMHDGVIYQSTINENSLEPGVTGSEEEWISDLQTDPTLIAIAGLSPGANQMIYFTGADVAALTALTSFGRSLAAAANASAGRAVLELITGFSMTNSGIDFPDYLGADLGFGGFKIRWGQVTISANSNTGSTLNNILPNRCLGGSAVLSTVATPTNDYQPPKLYLSGNDAVIYNSDNNQVTVRYLIVGD